MFESNEVDAKIGSFIARVACAVLGLCWMVSIGSRLMAWFGGDARFPTVWLALAGERTYEWSRMWGWHYGCAYWSISPSGVIPALFNVALSILLVAAAAFHRLWIYVLLFVVFFYYEHP